MGSICVTKTTQPSNSFQLAFQQFSTWEAGLHFRIVQPLKKPPTLKTITV